MSETHPSPLKLSFVTPNLPLKHSTGFILILQAISYRSAFHWRSASSNHHRLLPL